MAGVLAGFCCRDGTRCASAMPPPDCAYGADSPSIPDKCTGLGGGVCLWTIMNSMLISSMFSLSRRVPRQRQIRLFAIAMATI